MANIAIIGTGYVGSVSGACLADFGNHVICIDKDIEKIESLKKGKIPIYEPGLDAVVARNSEAGRLSFSTDLAFALSECNVIFIAVGTPPTEDGSADLSYVETAAREIGSLIKEYTVIVTKSTVPIGTGKKVSEWVKEELSLRNENIEYDVVSNPEFLREGSAVYDFNNPDRIIIGSESERAREMMKSVYRSLYVNETPYIETNLETAEMIKYASNAFLAVKITFINEVANLCEKTGANVIDVSRAMGLDERICSKYLQPGPGYGGSCFPKDTRALAKIGRDNEEVLSIIETTIESNEKLKIRAARRIEKALQKNLGSVEGKTVAILGLAFKQNTDDTRESPALSICTFLAERGMSLRLFDPAAMKEAQLRLKHISSSVYFAKDEYDAMKDANALVLATEWNQFRNIDLLKAKETLSNAILFDLRNLYKAEKAKSAGFAYYGVGN